MVTSSRERAVAAQPPGREGSGGRGDGLDQAPALRGAVGSLPSPLSSRATQSSMRS